ncbi:MAG: sigma-70 family RNA polymerase sigma factor [Verrucomicrobia bacterium]|nr:sigma-70 family RNA polymerase sigma factor [Verrucomicrobiota bacterium]
MLLAGESSSPEALQALETLCRSYWYPLYAYVRRQGSSPHDAQDLTQDFFAAFLAKDYVSTADRARGRFRWFLLASLKHFLANQRDRARAQKRGGGKTHIPLDELTAENRYCLEPSHDLTADKLYERGWAFTVLEAARLRLREEYTAAGKRERFDRLECFLPGEQSAQTYAQAAGLLGLSEAAVKSEIHRLKRCFGALLRSEIAETVADPSEIDEELRHLIAVLSG